MNYIGYLLSIIVVIYLAIDSRKHGKNPWLWGVLGFFFNLLVLGIYLIQTKRKALGILFIILYVVYIVVVFVIAFTAAMKIAHTGA